MKRKPWMTLALSLGSALALPAPIHLTGHTREPWRDDPAQLPWWMDDDAWNKTSCALHDALWHKSLRSLADEASPELGIENDAGEFLEFFTPASDSPGGHGAVAMWMNTLRALCHWLSAKTTPGAGILLNTRRMAEQVLREADLAGHRSACQSLTPDEGDSGYHPLRPGQTIRQHRKD